MTPKKHRILVTGGAGFIGSNFIRMCFEKPSLALGGELEHLVNLDKLTYAGNPHNLRDIENDARYQFVQGDLGDRDLVGKLLLENQINGVINFAAESHVDRSIDSPEPFFQTNVLGTQRFFHENLAYYRQLPENDQGNYRFLHVSTDEVYGSLGAEDPSFTEQTPYQPNSPYSASKAASDFIARAYFHTYKFPVLVTNCSNNYGPYQFPEKLIPLMILNALTGKNLPIYGDGMNVRDWLFVEDHCEAIAQVFVKGRMGETYNIGGLCEVPNIEVVDRLCQILDRLQPRHDGKSYASQKVFVTDRPGHDKRYSINCDKINQELGWSPRHEFASGLEETIRWYLNHSEWTGDILSNRYQLERLGGN